MYKKIVLVIITIFMIIGCNIFKKDGNSETDTAIKIEINSKPVSENADTNVYFKYSASKDSLTQKDFLYSYSLSEKGVTGSSIVYQYPETGIAGPNYEAEFKNLINGKSYIFKVKAYNPKEGVYSSEISYEFKVKYNYKFSYGVVTGSTDIYGEKSGVLKNGQTFKIYAKLENSDSKIIDTMLKSTTVKLKIDLSGFNGATLVNTVESEKNFEVNTTGAAWEIIAPTSTVIGNIKLEVLEIPYYKGANTAVIDSSNISVAVESRKPGIITLASYVPESDSAVIGKTYSVKVGIKNDGDTEVVLTSAGITVLNSSGTDISSQWTADKSLNGIKIPGRTTVDKEIIYTISSSGDLGDVTIKFYGKGYEAILKSAVEVQSDKKNVFVTSQ